MRCGRGGLLAAGLVLGACGEEPLGPVPVALVLTASDTITVTGGTLQFTVRPVDSAGAVVPGGPVFWSVDDTLKGGISVWGVLTARDSGRTWVRVRLASPPLAESVAVRIVPPGTVKWTWAAAEADPTGQFSTIGGPALGEDGTLYLLVEHHPYNYTARLVALSPGGAVQWTLALDSVTSNYPVVAPTGDILVAGQKVYAVRPDGTVRWQRSTENHFSDLISGAATHELALAAHGYHLTAFGLATGDTVWQSARSFLSEWLVPPTIVGATTVYAKHAEDTLFAFRLSDGVVQKTYLDPDSCLDNVVFGAGAVPVGPRFYLPTCARLAAFDTAGPLLWLTDEAGRGSPEPAVSPDGVLYVQNRRWGLQALNPDGTTRWYRRPVLPDYNWGTAPRWTWYGGPALAEGGIIYAAGQGAFYAYDAQGTQLWSYAADSAGTWQAFEGAPAIAPDGTVYSFTSTHLYAFWAAAPPEPNSPWPMWRHDAQRTGWAR